MTAGNPFQTGREKTGGRAKGTRNKLSMRFVEALCTDFEAHGEEVIPVCRIEDPATYLRVVASLLPKEFEITDNRLKDLSAEQLDAVIEYIRKLGAVGELDRGEDQTTH